MPSFSSRSDICCLPPRVSAQKLNRDGHFLRQPLPRNTAGKRWKASRAGRPRTEGRAARGRAGSQRCPNDRSKACRETGPERNKRASFRTAPGLIGVPCTAWDRGLSISGRRERSNGIERIRDPNTTQGFRSRDAARDCIALNATKTGIVYRLLGNAPTATSDLTTGR